jgi:hypothetical protein
MEEGVGHRKLVTI